MPIGLCKLCRQNKDLRDSHSIPRAMYKGTAAPGMRNPNPVVITRKQTGRTSRQIRDYVLWGDCERRFNKNGEDWMLKALGAGKRFPLRDRLDVAVPESATAELRRYSCSTTGINAEKLGYFALSVFWRGGIHDWRDPFGSPAPKLDLAEMEEPIRKYLYGEEQIPGKIALVVRVCDDQGSRETLLGPTVCSTGHFEMMTLGAHFELFVGSAVETGYYAISCVNSEKKFIFRRNCFRRMLQHYDDLERTSQRSKQVIAEWPD